MQLHTTLVKLFGENLGAHIYVSVHYMTNEISSDNPNAMSALYCVDKPNFNYKGIIVIAIKLHNWLYYYMGR